MNLRILSAAVLAVAASVLWMVVGTASATTLITSSGESYTGTLSAEAEGHVVLDNPISKIECASKVEGEVETHGESVTAGGKISSLSFTGCTDSWHVTVVAAGSLEVHDSGEGNGTVTSSGATVEATRFGVTCRYATNNTDIGTLTGGSPATLDINAAIPFHSGSIFCGTGATTWTGSYTVTAPTALWVVGSTLSKSVTQNGVAVKECKFTNVGDKCQIKFSVTGPGEGWRVQNNEWTGEEPEKRYKQTVGCTAKKLMVDKESCTDEIEMIKKVGGTENAWCVLFEHQSGKVKNIPFCTKLTM